MKHTTNIARRETRSRQSQYQSGSALIEIMVAIVIFALGILGILGLQTASVGVAADARYRTEAAALADEYIALMMLADPADVDDYLSAGGGAKFQAWYNQRVRPSDDGLKKVALPNANVTAVLGAAPAAPGNDTPVIVTVTWLVPSDVVGASRRHVTSTSIPGPPPTNP